MSFAPVAGTSIVELVHAEESVVTWADHVGIYVENTKDPERQDGRVYLTTRRLFYIEPGKSIALDLSTVVKMQLWDGFLKSSPKIILKTCAQRQLPQFEWTCHVCGSQNAQVSPVCAVCGVAADNETSPMQPLLNCPACTYLNPQTNARCEMCNTSLVPEQSSSTYKLSFRKEGHSLFYKELKAVLATKAWTQDTQRAPVRAPDSKTLGGIDSLMQNASLSQARGSDELSSALHDIDSVMQNTRKLLGVARDLNARLKQDSSGPNDEARALVAFSYASIGLPMPAVTAEVSSEETQYYKDLAGELEHVLGHLFATQPSISSFDNVWRIWNRARGVSLVSPKHARKACDYLSAAFHVRTLSSDLLVVHSEYWAPQAIWQRISSRVDPYSGLAMVDFARDENIPLSLGLDLLCELERCALVCRDETPMGINWFSADYLKDGG